MVWHWMMMVIVAGCTSRSVSTEQTTDASGPSAECEPGGNASAEFWIEDRAHGAVGPVECVVDDVRLAREEDDLDIEIDLGCESMVDGDSDLTPTDFTIKLGPAVARPEVEVDTSVVFSTERRETYCEESLTFTLHHADGELIAAGATATEIVTTLATGAAGDLRLARTTDDAQCPFVQATLGDATVDLYGGGSALVEWGGTHLRLDVAQMRHPDAYGSADDRGGDDCGGLSIYYDVIVMRLP